MKEAKPIREGLRQLPARPVYLVSVEHEGRRNVITIGMFAFFSGSPSLVGIGVKPERYSFSLIQKSGAYVVNSVDDRLTEAVRICGEMSGRECDKFKLARLTPVASTKINAPCIQEAPVSVECKVVQEVATGDHVWFIGEVQAVRVSRGYDWKDGLFFKWVDRNGFFYRVGAQVGRY